MSHESQTPVRRNKLSSTAILTSFATCTKYMVAGLDDGLVHVLTSRGEPLGVLHKPEHESSASSMVIKDHDLFIGRRSGVIQCWNLEYNILKNSSKAHDTPVSGLLLHGPETLVSCSRDTTVKIRSTTNWTCRHQLRAHTDTVIAIAAQDDFLVSASYDGTCRIWNLETGELLHTLTEHTGPIRCIAISGNTIVSGGMNGEVVCWSTSDRRRKAVLGGHSSLVAHVYIEDSRIVTAGADGLMKAWDGRSLQEVWSVVAHSNAVNTMEVRDGIIVTSGSEDIVKIWNLGNGQLLRKSGVLSGAVWKVGFTGDGKGNIFHAYWDDGAVLDVWNVIVPDIDRF